MSIRPPACCRALQLQSPVASDAVWLGEDQLYAAFQRFYAVSKTTRRYGSFVPGPLEARRRLGKRRMTHLTETGLTFESQAAMGWGILGRADKNQWQWKAPTTRPRPQEKPHGLLPDWLLSWNDRQNVQIPDEQNMVERLPLIDKGASVEEDAQDFQIQFCALSPQDRVSRWNTVTADLQTDLTLGLVSEDSIIRIRDMIWNMGGAFPEHESTLFYRLGFYKVLWEGLKASKVCTPLDLGANTLTSFITQIASLPLLPNVQMLLSDILSRVSTTQLEQMAPGVQTVLQQWTRSWLFDKADDNPCPPQSFGVPKLVENLFTSKEKLSELHDLVVALCESKDSADCKGVPGLQSRILAIHAALDFTKFATANCEKMLALAQIEKHIPMNELSCHTLARALAYVPQHVLLPIISTHARSLTTEERYSNHFRSCYLSTMALLPVVDAQLYLDIRRDLELGGVYSLEPEKAASVLSYWNSQGCLEDDALSRIINSIEAGVSSPDKDQIASLIYSLHAQNQDTWGLLDVVLFMLQKHKRYDEIFPILTQLHSFEYKIPSIIFNNLVRSLYNIDLHAASSIYQLSHDMIPKGDIMEAYRNPEFFFALIDLEQIQCLTIWEKVLRIPWYNFIPHDIRITLSKTPISYNEHRFLEEMALKFAHAKCRSPGLAFANINQVLWHIRQRQCKPTANISKAMCHAVITRDIARGGPTSGWIGPTRLDYVLGLVKELEGVEVAERIARLVSMWRQCLTDQLEERRTGNQH